MQAILKSPSSVVLKTKGIWQETYNCQKWRSKQVGSTLLSYHAKSERILSCSTYHTWLADDYRWRQNQIYLSSSVLSRSSPFNCNGFVMCVRDFSHTPILWEKEPLKPSSKIEETVNAIKEKTEELKSAVEKVQPKKPPLMRRIWDELVHYYHGFRLLFVDINISRKLLWRVLNGKSLSRREHRLLVRTVGDMFRLVPFSVFVIVPFMELLLPIAIKLFPGMLPSTFQTATERDDKLKQGLKVRLEMAKFLQTTLDDMSVQSKSSKSQSAKDFADFFKKVRSSGEAPSNEDIIKFSKLFEDEITLDSLSRQQLTALCRVLDINPMGTMNLLRFQIRMKLRSLAADDKMIKKEGIDSLTIQELQVACQARGMRAYGVSEDKLKTQLSQWLDLSLNEKVPPSLLLLSRALMLPETIATSDQLKATISALPDAVELKAQAAIDEREGHIDNKTKIKLIKDEVERIKEERAEQREAAKREKEEELVDKAPLLDAEKTAVLSDAVVLTKATSPVEEKVEEITTKDIEVLEDALDTLGKQKKKLLVEKEELDELKEELHEYEEDVQELKEVLKTSDDKTDIRETKAAKNLFKKVNSMISKMDVVLTDLEKKSENEKAGEGVGGAKEAPAAEELVRIDELMDVIRRMQKLPDEKRLHQISDVLAKIDDDHDGSISVDEVLKVVELIGKENVQLTAKQLDEMIDLLEKEEALELEGQIEKALIKQTPVEKIPHLATKENTNAVPSGVEKKSSPSAAQSGGASAAMSVSPNGTTRKNIAEPKDTSNGTSKQL